MSIRFTFKNAANKTVSVDAPTSSKEVGKVINTLRKGSRNFDTIMRNGGR